MHSKRLGVLVAGAIAVAGVLAADSDADARSRKRRKRRLGTIIDVQTPYAAFTGGASVIIPFKLFQSKRKVTRVEVQYGYDVNGDGRIADGSDPDVLEEYFPATQNQLDPRDTHKRKAGPRYLSGVVPTVQHAFSWHTGTDLPNNTLLAQGRFVTTPQGRLVPDPDSPEDFLRQLGEGGVKVRLRTISGKGRRRVKGPWESTDPFTVDNGNPPSVSIDEVLGGAVTEVTWTAADPDSEDANGNGVLDILENEDRDGDGVLDDVFVAVAFDFYLVEGIDPSTLTPEELANLPWSPCTRHGSIGETDEGVSASQVGTPHLFAWDTDTDIGAVQNPQVILRARGYDGDVHSQFAYWLTPFTPVNGD